MPPHRLPVVTSGPCSCTPSFICGRNNHTVTGTVVPAVISTVRVIIPSLSLLVSVDPSLVTTYLDMLRYLSTVRVPPTAFGALSTNPASDTSDGHTEAGTACVSNMSPTASVTVPGTVPVTKARGTDNPAKDSMTTLYYEHREPVTVVVALVTGPLITPSTLCRTSLVAVSGGTTVARPCNPANSGLSNGNTGSDTGPSTGLSVGLVSTSATATKVCYRPYAF